MAGRTSRTQQSRRIGVFLLCFGVPALLLGLFGVRKGMMVKHWPRADAVILASGLTVRTTDSGTTRGGQRNTSSFASADITYEYNVDGVKFVGDGLEPFALGLQNSAVSRKLHEQFPVGAKVEVAYDPRDPTIVFLKPAPSSISLLLCGVGFVLNSIAGWILLSVHSKIRGRSQIIRVNAG